MKLDLYNHIDSKLIENGSVEIFYDKIVWIDTVGFSQGMRIAGTPRVQQSIKGERTIDYKLIELSKGDLLRRKFKLTHKIESTPLKRLTSNEYYVSIGIIGKLRIKYWRKDFYFQKKELGRRIIDWFLGAIIGTLVTLFITTTLQYLSLGLLANVIWDNLNKKTADLNSIEIIDCKIEKINSGTSRTSPNIYFLFQDKSESISIDHKTYGKYYDSKLTDLTLQISVRKGIWNYYVLDEWGIINNR